MEKHDTRESYEAPALVEYGTIEEWTHEFIDLSVVIP